MYRKKTKLSKILYIAVIVILLIVFGVSAFYVADYFLESGKQKAEFDDLAAIVESIQASGPSETTGSTPDATDPSQPLEEVGGVPMLPEYAALYSMNQDIVGWMEIEGTKVNYPVMQTPQTVDFYLRKNFRKEYSLQGCLYAREQCDINTPSDNITIYGHNMRDGTMFATLLKYDDQEYWEAHDTITFDTLTEHHTYRIFAVFKTTASIGEGFSYHQFVDAATEEEFDDFVATCKALAFYDTGLTPVYGDKLITLSTCEYTLENGRFVVVAYRVS